MCEVLIRKHDKDADAEQGDVIFVAPDGHLWSRNESLETWLAEGLPPEDYPDFFYVIKIPNYTVDQFNTYLESKGATEDTTYTIDVKKLKQSDADLLLAQGYLEILFADVDKDFKVKVSKEKKSRDEYHQTPEWLAKKAEKDAAKAGG